MVDLGGGRESLDIAVANSKCSVDLFFCENKLKQKTEANKKLPGR